VDVDLALRHARRVAPHDRAVAADRVRLRIERGAERIARDKIGVLAEILAVAEGARLVARVLAARSAQMV
jgi:hypothetical protein